LGTKRTILAGGKWQVALYCEHFGIKNENIEPEKAYFLNTNPE
jgi:hypothetical protein